MQTFALTIQKLPGGGYAMSYALDGTEIAPGQAYAACSTLQEVVSRLVLPLMQEHFHEAPMVYARPYPPPYPPPALSEPVQQNGHDVDMPSVVQKHPGYANGHLSSLLVACVAGAWLWGSALLTQVSA